MSDDLDVVEGGSDEANEGPDRTISTTPWMVGIFCEECHQPWAEKAPCPHCGEYSKPEARIFRRVVEGRRWLPWTWRTGYEFSEEEATEAGAERANQRSVSLS